MEKKKHEQKDSSISPSKAGFDAQRLNAKVPTFSVKPPMASQINAPPSMIIQELAGHDILGPSGYAERQSHKNSSPGSHYSRASVADVARRLETTPHAVGRFAKAYLSGGEEAVERLRWGGGRPIKTHGLTQMEINDIVSKPRLVDEIGMPL